ncbi:helix-turn-helix domain-containing protein [Winogradskyella sp.]|jgi:hypothetical protein|uniref:helix-turn-helix domain-containing protein n=1 Tax=Winogradskyella sp. TaxID=1883156 RepID=UPI0025CFDC06|nr:helix-turn-helix domain-containing protein [Winogradskyella sp.]MCT4629599.1 helix-turn-helix domain-containing protein [Winogradskyella sp.]
MATNKIIQIESTNSSELVSQVVDAIIPYIDKLTNKELPIDDHLNLLTREETATILKVTLQTLHNWSKKGILVPFSIGNRIYYRKSDVISALRPCNDLKQIGGSYES